VGYGFLLTSLGVGTLLGSLSIAMMSRFSQKGKLLLATGTIFGLLLIIFANIANVTSILNLTGLNFGIALVILFLIGLISQAYTCTSATTVQLASEPDYLGRVLSAWCMVIGTYPFGCLLLGAEAQAWGAPLAVTLGGAILAAFMFTLALTSRHMRNLEIS
jgi:hypothetical protein